MEVDRNMSEAKEWYHELHRPQFHFTPKRDWMNDPNGLGIELLPLE